MNAEQLLREVKRDPTLIDRLEVGLSDVLTERNERGRIEVSFQIPADPDGDEFSGRPKGRPFHHVYLRREGLIPSHAEEGSRASWYQIKNGWAGGYLSDAEALALYLQGGEQLEMEGV